MGTVIVVAVVAGLAAVCARSLWKDHRKGGCGGDCSKCRGCGR